MANPVTRRAVTNAAQRRRDRASANSGAVGGLTGAMRTTKTPEQAWNESKTHQYYRSTIAGGRANAKRAVSPAKANSVNENANTIRRALKRGR